MLLHGGHVLQIAERVFIGGGCVFHQYIRVGRMVICQGGSAFSKDIPPFTTAAERNGVAGLNVVGLRCAGFTTAQRAEIKDAFALLYRRGLNTTQALLARARNRPWEGRKTRGPSLSFLSAAKSGSILRSAGHAAWKLRTGEEMAEWSPLSSKYAVAKTGRCVLIRPAPGVCL